MGIFGDTLRQAREDLGASLSEAERETRINRRYLEALEIEDDSSLPPAVYTRGFIRTYCTYLGLSPDGMFDLFGPRRSIEERVQIRPIPADVAATPRRSFRPVVTVAALVLFGLIVAYVWGQYTFLKENVDQLDASASARAAPTLTPGARGVIPIASPSPAVPGIPVLAVGSPSPGPMAASGGAASNLVVDAKVVEQTWLEVWVDGKSALAETVQPGFTRSYSADQQVRMRVGNAAGVQVVVNGSSQGPLGAHGQAVDAIWGRQ
jgi:hypothetical protein